jgi:hypothetical protein
MAGHPSDGTEHVPIANPVLFESPNERRALCLAFGERGG